MVRLDSMRILMVVHRSSSEEAREDAHLSSLSIIAEEVVDLEEVAGGMSLQMVLQIFSMDLHLRMLLRLANYKVKLRTLTTSLKDVRTEAHRKNHIPGGNVSRNKGKLARVLRRWLVVQMVSYLYLFIYRSELFLLLRDTLYKTLIFPWSY